MAALLEIRNLTVEFQTAGGAFRAVDSVDQTVDEGQILAIVGESGSGKSVSMLAMMGLLPWTATITADVLEFDGIDLRNLSEGALRGLRGARMSMVLQDPKFSLNPVIRIGAQIEEAMEVHGALNGRQRRARMLETLEAVRIEDPERVARLYPHEVSGGMGQRVMIAMMVVMEPALMIADEPTSALDVSVRSQVLDILDDLVKRRGMGLVLISHDLNMVARWCDRILVMYQGAIVEEIGAGQLYEAQHPYTQGLLASVPQIDERRDRLPVLDRAAL